MNIRLMAAALAVAIGAYSQTSTHDDPIIIRGGSVIFNFGLATKAFASSGLWGAQLGPNSWVYYQHTHMGTGTTNRTMQALGQARLRNPNLMQYESEKLLESFMDLTTQRSTRIEIFLKGVRVGGTQAEDLPHGPQIVLEAVDMTQPGSNPFGYKGVPCCAHRDFAPSSRPILGRGGDRNAENLRLPKEKDRNEDSELCGRQHIHAGIDASKMTWAWRVTSNKKLDETPGGPIQRPGSARYFVEAQYKDSNYQSVTLDSYSVWQTNPAAAGGKRYLIDGKGKTQQKIPFGLCPALELCATERVGNKFCELSTRDCKVNTRSNPQ